MTTIKASCPSCGDVELTPAQVRLVVCSVEAWSFYAFECSTCREEVRKHASAEVVSLLTTGGVPAERWDVPSEVLEERSGPAISWDEVLDFSLAIEGLDVVSAAASAGARRHRHLA